MGRWLSFWGLGICLSFALVLSGCPKEEEVCGDGVCAEGEDATSCAEDCGCGNGAINDAELCDGTVLGGETCESQGLGAGTLACNATCDGFDTTGCGALGCGDDMITGSEECDGTDLGGADCVSEGFTAGSLVCAVNCTLDTSGCCSDTCTTAGETQCDGQVIQTCTDVGGCLDWVDGTDCSATSEFCDDTVDPAVCAATCVDACTPALSTQCNGSAIETCVVGPDGCTDWSSGADCATGGQVCYDFTGSAMCSVPCTDDCPMAGDTACTVDTIDTCTVGLDGCNDWVPGTDCSVTGEACDDTMGSAMCVCIDQCGPMDATQCFGTDIETCGVAANGCLDWGITSSCPPANNCTDTPMGAVCTPAGLGEDCGNPYPVMAGMNTVAWSAMNQDYITAAPACMSVGTPNGPDVVLEYTAAFDGFVSYLMDKPTNTRYAIVVSDAMCGTIAPALSCTSEFTGTTMGDTFNVTTGTTYYFYVVDGSSGANPLNNPFTLTLTEVDCSTFSAAPLTLDPPDSTITLLFDPVLTVDFDAPVDPTLGVITVTGDQGTMLMYDLATSPAAVSFSNGNTTMTIDPGVTFPSAENVTVTWTGMADQLCGNAVASPTWSFQIVDCSTFAVAAVNEFPVIGTMATSLSPTMTVDFTDPVDPTSGVITIVGDIMTNVAYDLAFGPPTITFSGGNTTMTINTGIAFPTGENVTVSWSGLGDQLCGNLVPPIPWTYQILDCAVFTGSASNELPANGSITGALSPVLSVDFDVPMDPGTGVVTITGDLGTMLAYDLSMSPSEVTFINGGMTMVVDAGIIFPPGENVSVVWMGLEDLQCGNAIAPITWDFGIINPSCAPGFGGMIGNSVSLIPTGVASFTPYYVVPDQDPAGWVYFGGTANTYRFPKSGIGPVEDVEALATLGTLQQGYTLVVAGLNVFTVDSVLTGTNGRIYRITSDGGATWFVEDFATFSPDPGDDFRTAVYNADDGLIYLMTMEGTNGVPTQIWTVDPAGTPPVVATFVGSFDGGQDSCNGLAMDDFYYYTLCATGTGMENLIRVDRVTFAVEILTNAYDLSATQNHVYANDGDGDGYADYLYFKTWYEEGYYMCDPGGMALPPFNGLHYLYDTGASSSYGLGFDPAANVLWTYETTNEDLVMIQ